MKVIKMKMVNCKFMSLVSWPFKANERPRPGQQGPGQDLHQQDQGQDLNQQDQGLQWRP